MLHETLDSECCLSAKDFEPWDSGAGKAYGMGMTLQNASCKGRISTITEFDYSDNFKGIFRS